jgi:U4/U6.U5 tri-snRNP-associated protein 3
VTATETGTGLPVLVVEVLLRATVMSPAAVRVVPAVPEEVTGTDAAQVRTPFRPPPVRYITLVDRRDHRYDDRRDSDRRRKEDGRDRDYDQARGGTRKDGERDIPRPRSPAPSRDSEHPDTGKDATHPGPFVPHASNLNQPWAESGLPKRLNLDPDAPDEPNEEGEDIDDDAMLAMMGLNGFGSTKVCALFHLWLAPHVCRQGQHIEGNQEGGLSVKKQRTWRQYMNR